MKILSFLTLTVLVTAVFLPQSLVAQEGLTAEIVAPAEGSRFPVNLSITFSGSARGGEGPYAFVWDFGDGARGGGQEFRKTYTRAGNYNVLLTVTDFRARRAVASIRLEITAGPGGELEAEITAPANNAVLVVNRPITFRAEARGGEGPYAFVWNFGDGTQGGGQIFQKTYTATGTFPVVLTVTDFNNQEDNDGITLQIVDDAGDLVITNIRVTDITQTTATVRWTTNRPADSRVIYDTVSHPALGAPPNYGYAFSTATFNREAKVTEHAVPIAGLSPNTTYYFRAISQE